MSFRADLHCHTTCSDGTFTPEEIIRHAVEVGLQGLSITDHDTVEGYEVAIPLAQELGLRLLSGVEFSAKGGVHILGYGFDLENADLLEFCEGHVTRRLDRNRAILAKLTNERMPITEEELFATGKDVPGKRIYGRPHIALAMVAKGYARDLRHAFSRYLGDGRRCYAAGKEVTIEETLAIIHGAGGKAVIAHPHVMRDYPKVRRLLEMDFDGIEGYYAAFEPWAEKPWIDAGKRHNLIVTGGSDFHGANKPYLKLGSSWVDEETFTALGG